MGGSAMRGVLTAIFSASIVLLAVATPIVLGTTAADMQGRVFSLIDSLATAVAPLGLALAGPLADIFGVRVWFVAAGLVTGLMGIVGFLTPTVLYLEDRHSPSGAADQTVDLLVGGKPELNESR